MLSYKLVDVGSSISLLHPDKFVLSMANLGGKKLWNEAAANARIFRDVVYTFLHRVYNTTAFSGLCARRCQGLTSSVLRLLQFIIKNISKHSSLLPYCIIVMPFSREKFYVSLWHNFRKIIFLFTPKILLVILLTVCQTILILVGRFWY